MTYAIGSASFAVMCSTVWLLLGGTFGSAALMYLISGQVAMVSLITRTALSNRLLPIQK